MKIYYIRKRIAALRDKLDSIAPDTLWIVQPENRRYLSGFKAVDTQLNESSGSLLINRDSLLLITDSRYNIEAQREAKDFEVITLKKGLIEELTELLGRLNTRVLGFEEDFLSWSLHRELAKRLKRLSEPVRLTPMKRLVDGIRAVKDRSEIDAMEASADLMSEILSQVIGWLEPGRTEREIAWEIETLVREAGADGLAFPSIVASGPNAALPHAVPTDRRIRSKEAIILDVGLKLDGYCCDMTRTVFLERPGPKFRKIYRTVREAQLSALQHIRPGIASTHPDSIARESIAAAGFGEYFGHALGHGVGLATHEGPRLSPRKPETLEKGMVVTVEPGIYIPGKGGVRLEEMVVIEGNGPRVLTKNDHYYDF
ncbi:MAG: aminopeptidase P family protein [Deltaproteobacteria bacterium]|nr:aminopeptidase P family protein [Deltaproteobacteria bacterium]